MDEPTGSGDEDRDAKDPEIESTLVNMLETFFAEVVQKEKAWATSPWWS
jgi:hypothetical protein